MSSFTLTTARGRVCFDPSAFTLLHPLPRKSGLASPSLFIPLSFFLTVFFLLTSNCFFSSAVRQLVFLLRPWRTLCNPCSLYTRAEESFVCENFVLCTWKLVDSLGREKGRNACLTLITLYRTYARQLLATVYTALVENSISLENERVRKSAFSNGN